MPVFPSHGESFASVATVHPKLSRSYDVGVVAIDDLGSDLGRLNEGSVGPESAIESRSSTPEPSGPQ